jgi:hypothetical protein
VVKALGSRDSAPDFSAKLGSRREVGLLSVIVCDGIQPNCFRKWAISPLANVGINGRHHRSERGMMCWSSLSNIFSVRRGKRALQRPISVSRRSSMLLLTSENREELKRLAVKISFAIFKSLRLILENPIVKQSRNASNIH